MPALNPLMLARRSRHLVGLWLLCLASGLMAASPAAAHRIREAAPEPVGAETGAGETVTGPSTFESAPTTSGSNPVAGSPAGQEAGEPGGAHHRRANLARSCEVELEASTSLLSGAQPLTLHGTLECPQVAPAAASAATTGQMIEIFRHEAGVHGFVLLASVSTGANGTFALTPPAADANGAFYARYGSARSAHVRVRVSPAVTLQASALSGAQLQLAGSHRRTDALGAEGGGANVVTFTGTVTPAETGARVSLQRQNAGAGGRWRRVGRGEVRPDGTYSITHAFHAAGEANIRVVVRGRRSSAGASPILSYVIAKHQNPRLTIYSSADPIAFGESATISGTAGQEANRTVTLLARTRSGTFAPVAQAETGASGEYSFADQSPLQDTIYRVSDGHTSSTILREMVQFALTASPPADAVQAGQPVTFSGSVSPVPAGGEVRIESQEPSGIGFHTVATAPVDADGSYSIAYAFPAGAVVARVEVPSDEENLARTSEPMDIQVSPAPQDGVDG